MTTIHVVGIGLDGTAGLGETARETIQQATVLVGSDRHLSYFFDHPAQQVKLGDLQQAIVQLRQLQQAGEAIVVLASGDPLFFGIGRLLLTEFPPDLLTFHPHLSAIQLAFSRVKLPWQDARIVSVHGRSLDELRLVLQQGADKIAVFTDAKHTPQAIARLLLALDLPSRYQIWVCEALGGSEERVCRFVPSEVLSQTFAPLNIVILQRQTAESIDLATLPAFGLPDSCFLSFDDRPGLITKREVRILVLGELALQPQQIIWDIGAGTGSVSIEIARLFPHSQVYAVEKSAVGWALITENATRFQVANVTPIHGMAPAALATLPAPDRIFIGGSGGNLPELLTVCRARLQANGVIVLALATLEHLQSAMAWSQTQQWSHRLLQVQLARSVPIANLTRLAPLNPVTLLTLSQFSPAQSPQDSTRYQEE